MRERGSYAIVSRINKINKERGVSPLSLFTDKFAVPADHQSPNCSPGPLKFEG